MQRYSDEEIAEAIDRIDADVVRRAAASDTDDSTLRTLVGRLREMEAARRGGDAGTASGLAAAIQPELDGYRPTNSTSRAKAVLAELVVGLLASDDAPNAQI